MAFTDTLVGNNIEDELIDTANRLTSAKTLDEAFNRSSNPYSSSESDIIRDRFIYSNSSYSGTDCTVVVQYNNDLLVLGNISTFTYSIFREKAPVRTLGRSHAKGYTSGGRTIAGSLVFVVFDQNPLADIIQRINYVRNPSDRFTSPLGDQLPPLDLILIFHNEYGHSSIIRLYGLEFTQEGQVHSINDLYTENTMEYVARDIDIMVSYDKIKDFTNMLFERQTRGLFVDNYLTSMLEYKASLERQIQDINNVILTVDQELGRRTAAGVFTLGLAPALAMGYQELTTGTSVSRMDLQREKESQLKTKSQLLSELDSVNNQIGLYERNIRGWNGQQEKDAVAEFDRMRQSSTSSTIRG